MEDANVWKLQKWWLQVMYRCLPCVAVLRAHTRPEPLTKHEGHRREEEQSRGPRTGTWFLFALQTAFIYWTVMSK